MDSQFDPRYRRLQPIAQRSGRESWRALDLLSNQTVFLKRGHRRALIDECLVLLSLPPSVTPTPTDFFTESNPDWAWMVLPWMEGETLAQRLSAHGPSADGKLLYDLARVLEEVHHRGFVHVDLKPGNVFLTEPAARSASEDPDRSSVQLIDFGMSKTPFFRLAKESLGGTAPYLAPEVERGWNVDTAADIYALGRIIEQGFAPWMDAHDRGRWVERLCQPHARNRPTASDLRAELGHLLPEVPGSGEPPPRLGGGPLHGRESQLEATAKILRESPGSARLLIQARRGTGLTRFLMEFLAYLDQRDEPMPRVVEHSPQQPWNGEVVNDLHRATAERGTPFVLSVSDPSPGLYGLEAAVRKSLDDLFAEGHRHYLDPVGPDAFIAAAGGSFGEGGPEVADLGSALWSETEGDWRAAQRTLRLWAPTRTGRVSHGGSAERTASRSAEDQTGLPHDPALRHGLAVCARIGRRFPLPLAIQLLEQFGENHTTHRRVEILDSLIERGFLRTRGDELRFLTNRLHEEARQVALGSERAEEPAPDLETVVHRWILDHHAPAPSDLDACLEGCRRARLLTDRTRERQLYRACLEDRFEANEWGEILALLEFATSRPQPWATEETLDLTRKLAESYEIDLDWLRYVMADALKQSRPELALLLWEQLARSEDGETAVQSLGRLLNVTTDQDRFDRYSSELDDWEARGTSLDPGVRDLWQAALYLAQERAGEAFPLAQHAVSEMQSTNCPFLDLAYLHLAVLSLGRRDDDVTGLLEKALEHARTSPRKMTVLYNGAMIFAARGDIPTMLQFCTTGTEMDPSPGTSRIRHLLRQQLAWGLFCLNRARDAAREASGLERFAFNREQPAMTRFILGLCAHYSGDSSTALTALRDALDMARSMGHARTASGVLGNLVNVLLDTEHLEESGTLEAVAEATDPGTQVANARLASIQASAEGDDDRAMEHLESLDAGLIGALPPLDISELEHHRGWTKLRLVHTRKSAELLPSARSCFTRASDVLPTGLYGYYSLRARAGGAESSILAGDIEQGMEELSRTIRSAREIECQAALVLGLRARARLESRIRTGLAEGQSPDERKAP